MNVDELIRNRDILISYQQEQYSKSSSGIRLNMGCGKNIIPNFINIDFYQEEADLKLDLLDPLPYEDNSIEFITCHHVLEHLPVRSIKNVFTEWTRVLKPGGIIDIGVPDLELCMEAFINADEFNKWNGWIYTIYGYQVDDQDNITPDEGQFHKSGFTKSKLRDLALEAGLSIVEIVNYWANGSPGIWILLRKPEIGTVFEQDAILGVFTHRESEYLPALRKTIANLYPSVLYTEIVLPGLINQNMERLRQQFLKTNKRYWIFLDDDIEFLDPDTINNAIEYLVKDKHGIVSIYSTFDKEIKSLPSHLVSRQTTWATGYFIAVDSHKLRDVLPDLNLPHGNTSVDTSYSAECLARGYTIGIASELVYHTRKDTIVYRDIIDITNAYLKEKWGSFYFDKIYYDRNVLEWQ